MPTNHKELPGSPEERNLGIDALRVLAMLLIVILHVFTRGGAAGQTGGLNTARGVVAFPLRTLCMCAVDIYAMISGYVLINGRYRPARLLELWLQVFATGLAGFLIQQFILRRPVSPAAWLRTFLPVTHRLYWYFTAYTGLFCVIPILNRGLRAMKRRSLLALMAVLFSVFSLGAVLGNMNGIDAFRLNGGYSTLWLIILYILGACIKRTELLRRTAAWKLWLNVLASMGICLGIYALLTLPTFPDWMLQSEWLTMERWHKLVLDYPDPLLLTISVCLLVLFSRFRPGKRTAAAIRLLSPLTFGIFLIHVHDLSWSWLQGRFRWVGNTRALLILPAALGVGLAIFLVCAGLEWIRAQVFRLLRVRPLCDRLEKTLRRTLNKLVKE